MRKRYVTMGMICLLVGFTLASRRAVHMAERVGEEGTSLAAWGMGGLAYVEKGIRRADRVVSCDENRIVLWHRERGFEEFRFDYGVLWCNGFPLVTGLSGFYFEFRNQTGHRVHPLRSPEAVHRIAFTASFVRGGREVFIHRIIEAPQVSQEGRWVASSTFTPERR